jgi:hypothetical protein
MKIQKLVNAITKLNAKTVTIDWAYNSVILSGKKLTAKGEYTIALPAIGTTKTQVFRITVCQEELLAALTALNPAEYPCAEVTLQVVDKMAETKETPLLPEAPKKIQVLQIQLESDNEDDDVCYDDDGELVAMGYAHEYVEVEGIIERIEQFKVFYLDRPDLKRLAQKDILEKDNYLLKATKKVAEVTTKVTKKNGTVKTINIPQQDIEVCLEKDWEISVCLMPDDRLRIVHHNGDLVAFDKEVQTLIPTIARINFTPEEWKKMKFATKVVASLPRRSQSDHALAGVEIHTGATRIKGFSGISVYSAELGRSDNPGRFLVPQSGIDEFCRIQSDDDKMISLYFKENNEFVLTSESAALRGELMDVNEYPSDWHELPISREVPAEFNRDEFLQALSQVTRWLNWRNPTDSYCRIWWGEDALIFQGKDGEVRLRPKNKGYDTTPYKIYVSAVALAEIIENLDSRFRLALPTSDTEMCRLSDDKTEAGIGVLHEPHFISFKKEQQALPDALVQEVLDTNGTFECRAIEINPIAQAEPIPEPGEEVEEVDIISEVASFVRDYQDFRVFPEDKCPVADTIRDIYRLATPDGFAKAKLEHAKSKSRTDFNEYVFMLADLADELAEANESIVDILSEDLLFHEIPMLRILWQASLNREYYRGYNAALVDVEKEAKLQGIEIKAITDKLRSDLPDDLSKIAERLRIWIGRSILEEKKLAPITQIEFRPQ